MPPRNREYLVCYLGNDRVPARHTPFSAVILSALCTCAVQLRFLSLSVIARHAKRGNVLLDDVRHQRPRDEERKQARD
jgi:hypothetical protein